LLRFNEPRRRRKGKEYLTTKCTKKHERKKKVMLARSVPGLAEFLQVHSQASLQMDLQKLCSILLVIDQHLA